MDNKKILQKAIEKAGRNGYKDIDKFSSYPKNFINHILENYNVSEIIFSHDFAKAFWGEGKFMHWVEGQIDTIVNKIPEDAIEDGNYNFGESWSTYQPIWQYYLSKMVLCEEPLKYLEKFLKD